MCKNNEKIIMILIKKVKKRERPAGHSLYLFCVNMSDNLFLRNQFCLLHDRMP